MRKEGAFLQLISKSPEDSVAIGRIIGEQASPGDILAFVGELGSGKTCMTQGIARGLQVPEGYQITSPTFTLINEYPGRIKLYHLDIYRLAGTADLAGMGYEEYFYGDGVVVVEWAEKILEILPAERIEIHLRYVDETSREIIIKGDAAKTGKIRNALKEGGFC